MIAKDLGSSCKREDSERDRQMQEQNPIRLDGFHSFSVPIADVEEAQER